MSQQITRKLEFDAGHRVLGHESKCAHLHGHRYVAEVTVRAEKLDSLSRVVDFSVVKDLVGGWIDANWDHNMILNISDPLLSDHELSRRPFIMPGGQNPTAETIAAFLFKKAGELLTGRLLEVVHVRLYETPNCWADVRSDCCQ